ETVECRPLIRGIKRIYRKVKALFEPRGNAVGPFGRSIEGMIGDYRVRESCGRPPQGREVAVDHQVEDTWRFDFRVVDLNLIGLRASRQRAEENCHRQGKCEMEARRFPPSVRSHSYLDIRVLDLL